MTDLPYTDEDLRAEAARQHAALTEDPDFGSVGEGMEDAYVGSTLQGDDGETWSELLPYNHDDGNAYNAAQRKIHDLINSAADVSEWAVDLGAVGLVPVEHSITVGTPDDPQVRIHFAFAVGQTPAQQTAPVPGNLPEPVVLNWDTAAAHLRQRYGLPIDDALEMRERLTDAGVLRQSGVPCKEYRDLFWPVGRRFDIHAHALPILAGRVTRELYRLAEAQSGVQTALELDAIGRAALDGGNR